MKKYKIVITDSGLGGLDTAAKLYERLKWGTKTAPVDIIFVNALPETNQGYNKLPDNAAKAAVFNKVLFGIEKYHSPDIICIACNTLSVVAPLTDFYKSGSSKIINIIDIAVSRFTDSRPAFKDSNILIFGTETTIQSSEYQDRLVKLGAEKNNITAQMCPNLASEIERDYLSGKTDDIIQKSVNGAQSKVLQKNKKTYCILGCTHYGYVDDQFKLELSNAGFNNIEFINPNNYFVDDIFRRIEKLPENDVKSFVPPFIKIISRCRILPEEIESISKLLLGTSPDTISALQMYKEEVNLF